MPARICSATQGRPPKAVPSGISPPNKPPLPASLHACSQAEAEAKTRERRCSVPSSRSARSEWCASNRRRRAGVRESRMVDIEISQNKNTGTEKVKSGWVPIIGTILGKESSQFIPIQIERVVKPCRRGRSRGEAPPPRSRDGHDAPKEGKTWGHNRN